MLRYQNLLTVATLPDPFLRYDAAGPGANAVSLAGNGISVQQVDVGAGRYLIAAGADETIAYLPELNGAGVLRFGRAGLVELNIDTPANLLGNSNRAVYVVARVNNGANKREMCGWGRAGTLGAFDLTATDDNRFGYHRIGETLEGLIPMDQNQFRIYSARYWNFQNPTAESDFRGVIHISDGIRSLAEVAPAFKTGTLATGTPTRMRLGMGCFGQFFEGVVEVAAYVVFSDFITNEEDKLIRAELKVRYPGLQLP